MVVLPDAQQHPVGSPSRRPHNRTCLVTTKTTRKLRIVFVPEPRTEEDGHRIGLQP